MSSYREFASQHLSDMGVSGSNTTQQSFQNVTQSGVVTVTHDEDTTSSRIVQIVEFEAGDTGLVNTSLDFDQLDESGFVQEDAVSGTGFVDGVVKLYSSGDCVSATTFDPTRKSDSAVLSNSNRTIQLAGSPHNARTVLDGVSSGKYYWELVIDVATASMVGIFSEDSIVTGTYPTTYCGKAPYSFGYYYSGLFYYNIGTGDKSESYGSSYTTNNVIGISLDCDNNTVNFSVNGSWQGVKSITAGKTYFPGVCGGSASSGPTVTARFASSEIQYSAPVGFREGFGGIGYSYTTTKPYYITTSDNNQIDLSSVVEINSCTVTNSIPSNTSIKCLASFDDRSTWQKWGGASWAEHSDGLTNLQTGNTITELQTGFTNLTIASGTDYLDFAFDLGTTDSGSTPEIDQITINYDERGNYDLAKMNTDYAVSHYSTTQTKVTKDSVGTENIKVNILI